jgi:ribosomal protein S18 acetylase RimI-like enzyme
MPDFTVVPISRAERSLVSELMEQEDRSWMQELSWDYTPVRRVLLSFLDQDLLSGFVAANGRRPLGYGYFLSHNRKGIIGTLYASSYPHAQEAAEEVLGRMIATLRGVERSRRIEAQIMPFHDLSLTPVFSRQGFTHFTRYFLELALPAALSSGEGKAIARLVPWDSGFTRLVAEVALNSYRDEIDAVICSDYSTAPGCEGYVRSLVENPGCGLFLPDASFIALDTRNVPCGFIITSRISPGAAMIPQISIQPSHQGQGLGKALMNRALSRLVTLGYRSVSLTVTGENQRALHWYRRLGFALRKEFGAYVWERP